VRFDTGTAPMPVVVVSMRVRSCWQFTLNVLTFVSELVNEMGRPARPWVVRVGDFSVVEASCRASLVRVGTWSRRPVERASYESGTRDVVEAFRSLSRLVPLVWFFLIVDYGYLVFVPGTVFLMDGVNK
jgi:hypothetical protein